MSQLKQEVERRRIFGIISHPDAGKTTLTEKLLLHGGAIREAGTVKARKNSKHAKSDWMEIEKQRGISVTSSVMQFIYQDKVVSIMDTPGHNDFGEDTYRVLTSVDSAVMVIDAAKGIETQTKKLFQVCRMRGIPIFTFMNKLDRQAKDPLELMEELEEVLGMPSVAITWPIGSGMQFEGVYDRMKNEVHLFRGDKSTLQLSEDGVNDPVLADHLSEENLTNLRDEIDLLDGAGNEIDVEAIQTGKLTPVFFGTALVDFGVTAFLNHYLEMSPAPEARKSNVGPINPTSEDFSGFVFKIQANMNPAHRDRIAFVRICSGVFERGMDVTLTRTGKKIKLSQSTQLMANDRETVDQAFAGDVIGIYDSGTYQIGDTITTSKQKIAFEALPTFPPELFMRVSPVNSLKSKHFHKGVEQLAQEGAIQVYRNEYNEIYLGAVGQLQFEVFEYRLNNEYGVDIRMEPVSYSVARWVKDKELKALKPFQDSRNMLVTDRWERPVFLFANEFTYERFAERHADDLTLVEALDVNEEIGTEE